MLLLTRGPWLRKENREGTALPIPARSGPGSEGEVREKKEEALANLLVVFLGLGVGGLEVPHGEVRRRRREIVGEVAPTGSGRRGGVSELPEIDAKLMEGSG